MSKIMNKTLILSEMKKLRIQKENDREITIWFLIDENMSKIMEKTLILNEIQKIRKSKMVNLVFC